MMPQKQRVDPYGFVPLGDPPHREYVNGHHRFSARGLHGRLTCRLTAKTPLFIYDPRCATQTGGGHEQVRFPVVNDVAAIPGSSLKGVIRSVVEAVEPSCFILPQWEENGWKTYKGRGITKGQDVRVRVPRPFMRCDETQKISGRDVPRRLCPACHLFGSLHPKGDWSWAGKVSIADARSNPGEYELMPFVTLGVLSTPKPEARQLTYRKPNGEIMGRKFYRHRLDPIVTRPTKDRQNKTIQPVKPGSIFHFTVEYRDLREVELRGLLYGLFLEEGLWHKVGMGKPLGLGSAHIEAVRWVQWDPALRYRSLGAGGASPIEGDALARALADHLNYYKATKGRPDEPAHLKALREILRNDHNWDVSYPPAKGGTPTGPRVPRRR